MNAHRFAIVCIGLSFALISLSAPPAQAAFGFLPGAEGFDVSATELDGSIDSVAGSHPYALTTTLNLNLAGESPGQPGVPFGDGDLKDLRIEQPPGLIENPTVVSKCTVAQFSTPRNSPFQESLAGESCPDKSQVGVVQVHSSFAGGVTRSFGVFNLQPEPGSPAQIGFNPFGTPITLSRQIRSAGGGYHLALESHNFPQLLNVSGLKMTLWGNPWLIGHDSQRGNCLNELDPANGFGEPATLEPEPPSQPPPFYHPGTCSTVNPKTENPRAYLTLPTSCAGPMAFSVTASSWQDGTPVTRSSVSHDNGGQPLALGGCNLALVETFGSIQLATARASSASGVDFNLDQNQAGLTGNVTERGRLIPVIRAPSNVRKVQVSLPEGVTVNPSVAAGLGVCTPAQYAAESAGSAPGAGCPNASKIGEVSVVTPLLEGTLQGAVFLAQPDDPASASHGAENPFDSLLALYLVVKAPERGIIVKVAGKVAADPHSGQLTASFDDLPQLPYSHVNVHFRDGQRSPLATPSACGAYSTQIELSPWSDPGAPLHQASPFELTKGIGAGPCPAAQAPFAPASVGGTLNRNAGSYSPFYLHLTRGDADQEITSYSASFPKGLLGNISNIPYCPEAAIAAAQRNRGFAEAANPSCPAASEIGHTVSGYGLGSVLAYAPGGLYLAGPYHGSSFSIVAIDSATVGPFDLGVIIVRSAIRVDRRTAQVSIDSQGSDPIPHIIDGIPIHLRDVRVYLSRPKLTINPTSCDHFSVASVLTGSGQNFFDSADDSSAGAANPFQVSNCSALGFEPKLSLTLKGGTKRGRFPSLKAVVTPRAGDANIGAAVVTLPPSEFLAQEHLETICTRVQFSANNCPAGSIYGQAKATSPLLGAPLEGPVYLRASDNPLPDLVAALHGQVEIDVIGKIDSFHGGIRSSFDVLPDAPVSRFELTLRGGKRGVLANAENLCSSPFFASARFIGQDNAISVSKPKLEAKCPRHKKKRHQKHKGRR